MKHNEHWQGWKASFNAVMKEHNSYSADGGKACSYATQKQRSDVLLQGFRDLRTLGYKFNTVLAFRGNHMTALAQQWEKEGLSPATIQNRISVFRTFAGWIGKPGMILPAEKYVANPDSVKRSYSASEPRAWDQQGVDSVERIKTIKEANRRFGDALALQKAFGLRSKESLLLRPHLADKANVLIVSHGTKGGRTRYVPIETEVQRQLLDEVKSYIGKNESLVPKDQTYAECRAQYYYTLRKHGITREAGITPHGLRHEHLNELYKKATGHDSPVNGGELRKTDSELDSFGRRLVSERAGHSRESISSAYLGGKS